MRHEAQPAGRHDVPAAAPHALTFISTFTPTFISTLPASLTSSLPTVPALPDASLRAALPGAFIGASSDASLGASADVAPAASCAPAMDRIAAQLLGPRAASPQARRPRPSAAAPGDAAPREARHLAQAHALADAPWLATLSAGARRRVLRSAETHCVAQGDLLFSEGRPMTHWWGVLSGLVALAPAHSRRTGAGLPAGAWYGEQLLLAHARADRTATAWSTCVAVSVPAALFHELFRQEPAFARFVGLQLAQRLEAVQSLARLPQRGARTVPINAVIACALAGLFEPRSAFGGRFTLALTQSQLADFLGLSRQRTNAALNALRRQGELSLRYGCIDIAHPARLRARALAGEIR